MGRRNVSMVRLGRCAAFLAAAAFFLPFTILLMVADQQYHVSYSSKRMFYQENDFYALNITSDIGVSPTTNPITKYIYDNGSNEEALLPKDKFMEISARMEARKEYLTEKCSTLGLDASSHKAYAWEYLINRQYHVIWCNIFKAASTSWMYNFNLMANYSAAFLDKTQDVPLQLARKKYGRPTVEMIRKAQPDSITFLIVRHPLERLASAYNDKILRPWRGSLHDKMGKWIIRRFRKKSDRVQPKRPQFEEFVAYVLSEVQAKHALDMHWTPYTDFCTPCKFNFDVILKFETLNEDQKFLIQLAHLQEVVKPEWKNSGKGKSTKSTISKLYSRLSRQQLDGLQDFFKYDLQLFNYTNMQEYYDLIKDKDTSGQHG